MSRFLWFLDEVYYEPDNSGVRDILPLDHYEPEQSYLAVLIILVLAAVVITAIVLIVRVVRKNRKKEADSAVKNEAAPTGPTDTEEK
ncbi:MAG: hypothetical protein K6E62_06785 [Lachnospiraceae bacterium]|jgi:flagellar biosynthesis/type III secretory pathway M-ring protein FliF/YscJ|nr:hypothetical protein [Lachnospiraceae bacterium]